MVVQPHGRSLGLAGYRFYRQIKFKVMQKILYPERKSGRDFKRPENKERIWTKVCKAVFDEVRDGDEALRKYTWYLIG